MILGLVFSKDRALQLDGCLASFFRHVQDAGRAELVVVYGGSSERYLRQYAELSRTFAGKARFLPEADFRRQVVGILRSSILSGEPAKSRSILGRPLPDLGHAGNSPQRPDDLVLFLVDDTLLVSPISLSLVHASLEQNRDALGFSLRLGRNTTQCYVLNRQQQLPAFERAGDGILKYAWTNADGDFAYPLEISSSVYRRATLAKLISGLRFSDPNTLESQLALRARRFSRSHPWMLCPDKSVAFSTPINRVQEVYENRAGENPDLSTGRLADKFDQGLRINFAAMDGFVPSACHQEVELSFEHKAA